MVIFLFLLGILQCFIIWALGRTGLELRAKAAVEREAAQQDPPMGWPSCAMIIPASGSSPHMEKALRSLLAQDYPRFTPYIVVAGPDDPVFGIIGGIKEDFPDLVIVVAGAAKNCSQKNFNLLAGVARAGSTVDAYVFCDSTHVARPDFLRCLLLPIARHETAFTAGYHEVVPGDKKLITLAYALTVLCMRFMEGIPALTQPWGGALAMRRQAFEHYGVASLWARNVVDDCSLAGLLQKAGTHIRHSPGAILETLAMDHRSAAWSAWLERQVLFLKFCLPGQWVGLGLYCALMIIPPIWCGMSIFWGILGLGSNLAPFLALCWLCLAAWAIGQWRVFLPSRLSLSSWLWAFLASCGMFALAYMRSISADSIIWNNIVYKVGPKGDVLEIQRPLAIGGKDESPRN